MKSSTNRVLESSTTVDIEPKDLMEYLVSKGYELPSYASFVAVGTWRGDPMEIEFETIVVKWSTRQDVPDDLILQVQP